ncbi:MAG TPA: starch-binding protein, partial [Rhodospirillales bacterium]|nr:starch-binding protein [Rhodospirillales bacterium]
MPDLTIHFRKPADWAEPVRIHYWDTRPAGASTTWPGVAMTWDREDWWRITLAGIEAAAMVFNDSAGRQTGNQWREGDGWLDTDGRWRIPPEGAT